MKSVINLLFAAYTGDVSALRRWLFIITKCLFLLLPSAKQQLDYCVFNNT